MPATCFDCGQSGHVAAECPNSEVLDTRPTWCGICDRRTRLVTVNIGTGAVKRGDDCDCRCPGCLCGTDDDEEDPF